jgi:DNA-binding transcriptional LysR family regulator
MASIEVVDGIDPSALRLFLAAVELGSVSKAGARMHVSQPSATAKLQKLERQLGLPLLERTPTGSRATVGGARLASSVADALDAVTALVDRAEAIRAEAESVAIATTRHVADHFLPGWLTVLAGTRISISEHDTLRVARAVRDGEATIGFTEGPAAPLGLRSQVVATEAVVAVVGRGHPWFGRRTAVTSADLVTATTIMSRPGSGTRDVVEAAFAEHGLGIAAEVVEVPNASAARLMAVTGAGVAFLPSCWVSSHLSDGSLTALPLREPRIELPIRIVWRGTRPGGPSARRLLASLSPGDDQSSPPPEPM